MKKNNRIKVNRHNRVKKSYSISLPYLQLTSNGSGVVTLVAAVGIGNDGQVAMKISRLLIQLAKVYTKEVVSYFNDLAIDWILP